MFFLNSEKLICVIGVIAEKDPDGLEKKTLVYPDFKKI